jgi:hypothetical protein
MFGFGPDHAARRLVASLLVAAAGLLWPALGAAQRSEAGRLQDGRYMVGRGETLSEIAGRLRVPMASLAEANHLGPPYAVRTGRTLRLPSGVTDEVIRQLGGRPTPRGATPPRASSERGPGRRPTLQAARGASTVAGGGRWGRPAARGFVRLVRLSTGATESLHMRRISNGVLSRMRAFLRFADGRSRAIHPRLLRQLATVSDHFGGRRVQVISGFRPFRRGQWTPHSNHNVGKAIDFRVEGVPNRVLRDFCRTLPQTGCGYYPRSVFVHMDVREESAYWVDWSRPGQRPQYGREERPPEPSGPAVARRRAAEDEGVDDVAQDDHGVRSATAVEEHDDDERARREGGEAQPSEGHPAGGSGAPAPTPRETPSAQSRSLEGAVR